MICTTTTTLLRQFQKHDFLFSNSNVVVADTESQNCTMKCYDGNKWQKAPLLWCQEKGRNVEILVWVTTYVQVGIALTHFHIPRTLLDPLREVSLQYKTCDKFMIMTLLLNNSGYDNWTFILCIIINIVFWFSFTISYL